MKKRTLALILALILAFTPIIVLAAPGRQLADAQEAGAFDHLRLIELTMVSRDIVLEDFDYLVGQILAVAPTQNIIYRRFGITAVSYFDIYRNIIYNMTPLPSFLSTLTPTRWATAPEGTLYTAADYMFTILFAITSELGGLGHLTVQHEFLVEQTFFALAHAVYSHRGQTLSPVMEADLRFAELQLEVFNQPPVLWFYDINPDEFSFDTDILEVLGMRDYANVTTDILADGVAYIHIASFLNNMLIDMDVLFPFYEEIQDFDHLIIDLRGNAGGWVAYFPSLVASMLLTENVTFTHYEMFIDHPSTAQYFENPISMVDGELYGTFPVAEFVASRGMTRFNQSDLALLDYVMVWEIETHYDPDGTPFGGQIWMLVDGESMSASEMAASFAISTDFATVVGEPTGGVTGVIYTYVAAPNTGIIFRIDLGYTVDRYGRSIEEFGIVPQITNAPGMDALETVLALIAGYDLPAQPASIFSIPPPPLGNIPAMPAMTPAAAPTATHITRNGVEYVALRHTAYQHGYSVEWDGPNNLVLIFAPDGSIRVLAVDINGVFNDDGKVFIPAYMVEELFTTPPYVPVPVVEQPPYIPVHEPAYEYEEYDAYEYEEEYTEYDAYEEYPYDYEEYDDEDYYEEDNG